MFVQGLRRAAISKANIRAVVSNSPGDTTVSIRPSLFPSYDMIDLDNW